MDCRGFNSVEEMHTYIVDRWNKKVRKNDEVFILGDLSWGKAPETNDILARLKGRLYLIQGNHDRYLSSEEFNHERFEWTKPYGEVHDTMDQRLLEQFQEITRNTTKQSINGEEQNIPCNMINCFCMYSNYTPLTLDEWIECDENRRRLLYDEGLNAKLDLDKLHIVKYFQVLLLCRI